LFEFVDDADVGDPSHSERHVEVNDVSGKWIGFIGKLWGADESSPASVDVCPHEYRHVKRHIVDPNANDNGRSYADFESRSTMFLYSQKAKNQYAEI